MRAWLAIAALALLIAGCTREAKPVDGRGRPILRVGYMPNLTHAPALLGVGGGVFEERLGPSVAIEAKAFNAGPSVIEAIFAGDLDVAYVGPNPAINGFVRSRGTTLRIVAGSTAGGAALVVQPNIRDAAALAGLSVAVPAIANTQDVSLRTWLHANGLRATGEGGTVQVLPLAASDIITVFRRGGLAGAWVPEPTTSRLILESGGVVLVDERTLWPKGTYPTTEVIASTVALRERPELVRSFVAAHAEAVRRLNEEPGPSRSAVNGFLRQKLHIELPPEVTERAFDQLGFGIDPLADELFVLAERAERLGYLPPSSKIEGIIDLRFLPPAAPSP